MAQADREDFRIFNHRNRAIQQRLARARAGIRTAPEQKAPEPVDDSVESIDWERPLLLF